MNAGALARGVTALAALAGAVLGVPILLVLLVGNPWPGWERIELGDERTIVVGALAALAWIVWARFVLAVIMAVPVQVAELREEHRRAPDAPVRVTAPSQPGAGVGLIAARLVAAALVLLPVAARDVPVTVAAPPLPVAPASATLGAVPTVRADHGPPVAAAPRPGTGSVRVGDGDTLVGIARRHLGDGSRWREIFELNRDRPQPRGMKLTSPSAVEPGWTLILPADATVAHQAPPPGVVADTVTVAAGDTLWDLAHERLEESGRPHDDRRVAEYVADLVAANPGLVEDPDLIYPGQQIRLPADGPPAPNAAVGPAEAVEPPPPAAPPPDGVVPAGAPTDSAPQPSVRDVEASTVPATTVPLAAEAPTDPAATPPAADGTDAGTPAATTGTPPPAAGADVAPSTSAAAVPPPVEADGQPIGATGSAPAPFPIGVGEAALLSSGVLALLAARRRVRLRASQPRARVPEPAPEQVGTERALRSIDAGERLLRVDVAVRAAAASLLDGNARPAVIRVGADGQVELTLTSDAVLPSPWRAQGGRWVLPGTIPVELLADAARMVSAPCLAVTQLGTDDEGREVLVDLEALGVLSVHGPDAEAAAVLRGIAATLATSAFADVVNLVGVGVDEVAFLEHRLAHRVDRVDEAVELATTLIGTTASARQSTFVLRARHTSGEAWEPAVVLVSPEAAHELTPALVAGFADRGGGLAMVAAGDVPDGPWTLRASAAAWRLEPIGLTITPVGLTTDELAAVYDVLHDAVEPLVADDEPPAAVIATSNGADGVDPDGAFVEPPWELMVRLLGTVDVVDRAGRAVRFERSKTMELVAWLTLHRGRSTRAGARTALWELDVRDATFANVVSEARRAMARHVSPPTGDEWLERTLTERLPLHRLVVSDADVVRARLEHARLEPPQQAIETLRPAVELIRDVPFAGTGYLWPDPEGIASNLVLLATSAATELAAHFLSIGDVDGVFWSTGQGLRVLPGHEELIALRMRAHHRAGDLSGVRLEWESYERVLDGDPWSDGEPAEKLVVLRRQLLSGTAAS